MKKYYFIGFVLIFGCGQKNPIPENFIPEEEFTELLYGMEIIDAIQIQNIGGEKQSDSVTFAQYKFLFDSLKVNREQFDRSFSYYQKEPEKMKKITDTLVARLSREEEKISKELRDLRWKSNKEED